MPGFDGAAHEERAANPQTGEEALTDLVFLGALACTAPIVMIRFRDADGGYVLVAHGLSGPFTDADHRLIEAIADSDNPLDLPRLGSALPARALAPPQSMRWGYGLGIRDSDGTSLLTIAMLDRWPRQLTKKEHQVLGILARRAHYVLNHPQPNFHPVPAMAPTLAPSAHPMAEAATLLPQLLRATEVAKLFDVTERTVLNWTSSGRLPCIRTIGGHLRYRRPDILQLLEMDSIGTGSAGG